MVQLSINASKDLLKESVQIVAQVQSKSRLQTLCFPVYFCPNDDVRKKGTDKELVGMFLFKYIGKENGKFKVRER